MAKYVIEYGTWTTCTRIVEARNMKDARRIADDAMNDDEFVAGLCETWRDNVGLNVKSFGVGSKVISRADDESDTDWPKE